MKKKNIKYIIYFFIVVFFLVLFAFTYSKCIKYYRITNLVDNEYASVNYNVYLKENDDFNETYYSRSTIEKENKKLISNLIDHLNIKYNYKIKLNSNVSGYYTYYIKAILSSEQKGANFWIKEYALTKEKTIVLDNMSEYSITDEVDVNYQDYYKILLDFKSKYNIDTDELAKFVLVVNSHYSNNKLDIDFDNDNNIELIIPLNDTATSIEVNESVNTKDNELMKSYYKEYEIYGIMCLCSFMISIIFIILIINLYIRGKRVVDYNSILKGLLDKYDDIIVDAKGVPEFKKYNVIQIKNFDELLDVYNNVQEPINHYQEENKAIFTIINKKVIYVYELIDKSKISVK